MYLIEVDYVVSSGASAGGQSVMNLLKGRFLYKCVLLKERGTRESKHVPKPQKNA